MKKRPIALLLALVLLLGILPVQTAAASGQKLAAITFDDGPGPYTDGLLDELAKRNVVVTFFMQGYQVPKYSAVVKKAYEAGHQIASHTYDHPSLTKLSAGAIQKQLSATTQVLNSAVGVEHTYMVRPPYGNVNANVLSALNVPAILWSVDTLDWKSLNADAVCKHIAEDTKDGSIVLLHDIHATSIPGALRGIDALLAQGYELVTVNELLRRRGLDASAGKKYFSAPGSTTLPGIAKPVITATETENGRYVTLTADPGLRIYYTTDGSAPTSQSALYTAPFPQKDGAVIKAFAVRTLNGGRSQVSERTLETSRVQTPVITVENGLASITGEGGLHYTLDGTAPTKDSALYTGPLTVPANTLIRAIAVVPGSLDSPTASLLYSERGNLFSDVLPAAAYYPDVDRAVSEGLMQTRDHKFLPEQSITRGEAAEVLYRLAGSPEVSGSVSIPDVDSASPVYPAVVWAMEQHILTGFADGKVRPGSPVTREQLAMLLFRMQGMAVDEAASALYGFLDWETVHQNAREAMDWAVSSGVFDGLLDGASRLSPSQYVTRAQLAGIVLRSQENARQVEISNEEWLAAF